MKMMIMVMGLIEIKSIMKRFEQLFKELKRGVKENRGALIISLDLLKDCEAIDDNDYEKGYNAIENICDMYVNRNINSYTL